MASAAGLVLAAGGITAANEVLFAPAASHKAPAFQWRIVPATLLLAMAFGGLESAGAAKLAQGLGWTMLVTVTLAPVGHAPSLVENVGKIFGKK